MEHELNQRLTDAILHTLDPDTVHNIMNSLPREGIPADERDEMLVLSGVNLGIEEVQKVMNVSSHDELNQIKACLQIVDEQMETASTAEVSQALAVVRKPLHDAVEKIINAIVDTQATKLAGLFGFDRSYILEETPLDDYSSVELIQIGAEAMRRVPVGVYGWHVTFFTDKPPEMKCKCPSCCSVAFTKVPDTPEVIQRAMVKLWSGMDSAYKGYARFLLDFHRNEIATLRRGVIPVHEATDPETSSQAAADYLKGMMGRIQRREEGDEA